jgi:hypothetical protein
LLKIILITVRLEKPDKKGGMEDVEVDPDKIVILADVLPIVTIQR